MFRLLRFIFWTAVFFGFVYFALAVPLGNHSLAGHLMNLWRSPEGRELRDGTREAARPVIEKIRRGAQELKPDAGLARPEASGGAAGPAQR